MNGAREIEIVHTVHGSFFALKDDLITRQLKQYSAHARNELAMALSFIREADAVIDIGAHIGTFSIPFANRVGAAGKVYAFEADCDNYALLEKNILNNAKATIVQPFLAMVFDKKGMFKKHVSGSTSSRNTGETQFLPTDDPGEAVGPLETINIDEWFYAGSGKGRVRFLKVDTEGAEVIVLRSCKKLIAEHRPIIYCEVYDRALRTFQADTQQLDKFFRSFGYHYFKNIGLRNSTNDEFTLARLRNLKQGGPFFDVLAVHPDDARYPRHYTGSFHLTVSTVIERLTALATKVLRYVWCVYSATLPSTWTP